MVCDGLFPTVSNGDDVKEGFASFASSGASTAHRGKKTQQHLIRIVPITFIIHVNRFTP